MKKILIIVVSLIFFTLPAIAFSTNYPANAPWSGGAFLDVQTSQFGRAIIYVPVTAQNFSLTTLRNSETPVNATVGTISGEMFTGAGFNVHRQIRWQRASTAEHNANLTTVGGANWQPLTITAIHNTNLNIANQTSNPVSPLETNFSMALVTLVTIGGIFVCLVMCFKR